MVKCGKQMPQIQVLYYVTGFLFYLIILFSLISCNKTDWTFSKRANQKPNVAIDTFYITMSSDPGVPFIWDQTKKEWVSYFIFDQSTASPLSNKVLMANTFQKSP